MESKPCSEDLYSDYRSALLSGASSEEVYRLWNRWQDRCIENGEFYTKGKKAVGWW